MKTVTTQIPNKEKKSNYYKMHVKKMEDINHAVDIVLGWMRLCTKYEQVPPTVVTAIEDLQGLFLEFDWWTKL